MFWFKGIVNGIFFWKSMGVVNCFTNILQQYLILCSVEETRTDLEKSDKPK